jgi:hypothetical protein
MKIACTHAIDNILSNYYHRSLILGNTVHKEISVISTAIFILRTNTQTNLSGLISIYIVFDPNPK